MPEPGRPDWRIAWPPSRWRRALDRSPRGSRAADETPGKGFALEELSISAESFSSDREGGPSPSSAQRAPRTHSATLTHPLESRSFVRRHAKCGRNAGRPRVQDFPGNPARPSLRTLRDDRRVADPPNHALGHEIAVATRHPLGVSAGHSETPLTGERTHLHSMPANLSQDAYGKQA